jgi:hypothetical protein
LKVYGQFRVCCGCLIVSKLDNVKIYRVIRKSIRDFRPLRYSSRDGHTEGEHVNRGTDTPSFYPTLQVLDMSKLGDVADVNPAKSKTQNAFVFTVHAMFRHDCPLAVKPASTPRRLVQKRTWRDSKVNSQLLAPVFIVLRTYNSKTYSHTLKC